MPLSTLLLLIFVIVLSCLTFALLPEGQRRVVIILPLSRCHYIIKEIVSRCTTRRAFGGLSIFIVSILITRTISNSKPGSLSLLESNPSDIHIVTTHSFDAHDDKLSKQKTLLMTEKKNYPTPDCKPRKALKEGRVLTPGEVLYDDRGMIIHAHGGGILIPKQAGAPHTRYFWYGESAKNETNPGVQCYSSDDLYQWRFEGRMIDAAAVSRSLWMNRDVIGGEGLAQDTVNDTLSPKGPRIVVERPKVVFCPATRLYVMYFHLDHYQMTAPHYHWRTVGVATSRYAVGPFTLKKVLRPDNLPSLDLTLHQVREGNSIDTFAGDVFLIRSVDNRQVAVSKLSADFMDTESDEPISTTEDPLEGYGVLEIKGKYYLLASLLRGWMPSPLLLFELTTSSNSDSSDSSSISGSGSSGGVSMGASNTWWRPLPSPSTSVTTHFSQCSFVIPTCDQQGNPYFIYLGDRWNMHPRSPTSYGKGLAGANYIFLPLFFNSSQQLLLPWRSSWNIDDPFPLGTDAYKASDEEYIAPKRGKYSKLAKMSAASGEPADAESDPSSSSKVQTSGDSSNSGSSVGDSGSSSGDGGGGEVSSQESSDSLQWGVEELERIRGVLDDDWVGSSKARLNARLKKDKEAEEEASLKLEKTKKQDSDESPGAEIFVVAASYMIPQD